MAALGFVFGLRSTAFETEPATARWIVDLLQKLGREDDAYDAVCLLVLEYGGEPIEVAAEELDALADAGVVADEEVLEDDVPLDEVERVLQNLPTVRVRSELAPEALSPDYFMKVVVDRVLDVTPITLVEGVVCGRGSRYCFQAFGPALARPGTSGPAPPGPDRRQGARLPRSLTSE